tara:strand:- start:144 stop:674 length:531 start_codon:yes stop_codon:yes gene_type:complete
MSKYRYYVYHVTRRGIIVYVGKGQGDRHKHALSGKSHNVKLNTLWMRYILLEDVKPEVHIVQHFRTEDEAYYCEKKHISIYQPSCNRVYTKNLKSPTKTKYLLLKREIYYYNKRASWGGKVTLSLGTNNKPTAIYMVDMVTQYIEDPEFNNKESIAVFIKQLRYRIGTLKQNLPSE